MKRFPKITIRSFFFLILAIAIPLGFFGDYAFRERVRDAAIAKIIAAGGILETGDHPSRDFESFLELNSSFNYSHIVRDSYTTNPLNFESYSATEDERLSFNDEQLRVIVSALGELDRPIALHLKGGKITDAGFQVLFTCRNVWQLKLLRMDVTDSSIAGLEANDHLQFVRISECPNVSDGVIDELKQRNSQLVIHRN